MSNQEALHPSQLAITDERALLEGAQAALRELREYLTVRQGEVHPIPHHLYVELVRGAAANPHLAGKTIRLAEWYVRMTHGTPETVVNETYALLTFDAEGRVDWAATPSFHPHRDDAVLASESASLPTPEERDRMLAVLFGTE